MRWLHVVQMGDSPFFAHLVGDAVSYHGWALRLVGGDWLGEQAFYQAPLYPYFLAGVYTVFGVDPSAARAVQIVVGAGSCVMLALAGRRWFGDRVGLVAGCVLALYAPAIFFDALIQKSVLDVFFVCALLWIVAGARPPRRLLALGVVNGLLVLTRENTLVLVIPVAVWIAVSSASASRIRSLAAYAVGLALILGVVAARNWWVEGALAPTTTQLGPNLYIGNHPGASGMYQPIVPGRGNPRFEQQDATRLAELEAGRALSPGEVSSYWTGRVVDFARSEPLAWSALLLRKAAMVVNATEVPDTEDQYVFALWSAPLRWGQRVFHFGVWIPLACVGGIALWPRRRELALLYTMPLAYAAAVALFFVMARYRLPLVPFVVLLATAGIFQGPRAWREASTHKRVAALCAVVAVAVLCNWPLHRSVPRLALAHYNLATRLQRLGDLDAAVSQYRSALEHAPLVQAHNNLGMILRDRGETEAAIRHFRAALAQDPNRGESHSLLARALREQGRLEEALPHFRRAADQRGDVAFTHFDLAEALRASGDLAGARRAYENALRIDPEHPGARRRLRSLTEFTEPP